MKNQPSISSLSDRESIIFAPQKKDQKSINQIHSIVRDKLFLILIFFIPLIGLSQTDFRKGYIITNERDTVSGWTKYRESSKAYNICAFKKSEDQVPMMYGPNQIAGYGYIEDSFFESRTIKKKDGVLDTVFVEVILKGFVSLYKFERSYWIGKEGESDLTQLRNEFIEVYVGDALVRKKSNQYVSTLSLKLGDCESLRSAIQRSTLNERPLTRLISDYNKCKGSPVKIFKEKKPWVTPSLGISGGVDVSNLTFTADNNLGYNSVTKSIYGANLNQIKGTYASSATPTFGITLALVLPRFSEHFSFVSGVSYLSSKYNNFTISSAGTLSEGKNYVTIDLQQLKIPLGFRYTFTKRKISPFVNVAFSSTFHLHSDFKWTQEISSQKYNYDNRLKMKSNQTGFWGGLGIEKSIAPKLNASLECRYELTNGIVSIPDYAGHTLTSISNLQIILGLRAK